MEKIIMEEDLILCAIRAQNEINNLDNLIKSKKYLN